MEQNLNVDNNDVLEGFVIDPGPNFIPNFRYL